MKQKTTLVTGAIAGALAVAIGAFGAHGLKEILQANQRMETFELAVRYQFYHAFAMLAAGFFMNYLETNKLRWAATCFVIGIILFSGSLYVLSLSGLTVLGAVTPLGGVCFIAGWIFLAVAFSRAKENPAN